MAIYAHLAHLFVHEVNLKHIRKFHNLMIYLRDYHVLNSLLISPIHDVTLEKIIPFFLFV